MHASVCRRALLLHPPTHVLSAKPQQRRGPKGHLPESQTHLETEIEAVPLEVLPGNADALHRLVDGGCPDTERGGGLTLARAVGKLACHALGLASCGHL